MAMQISEGDDDDLYYDAASEDDFEAEDESDSDIDEDDFRHHFGTSLDILRKFIDDSMVEKIAVESNRYAEQVKRTSLRAFIGWTPVTAANIWRFLSLILAMTLVKKSSYKEYWSIINNPQHSHEVPHSTEAKRKTFPKPCLSTLSEYAYSRTSYERKRLPKQIRLFPLQNKIGEEDDYAVQVPCLRETFVHW
ncbi:hypothetical protein Fcan01_06552 [Folsomia candida]|uniref:PiggyBac transposable element-derived protein domain-containing protein n=2 Tax=Folsomia candida TaxID=158441 RepID=A0A226ENE1_FOLCA|nr:hypothetical protein Fcan01_06552 [Folsomia candida]